MIWERRHVDNPKALMATGPSGMRYRLTASPRGWELQIFKGDAWTLAAAVPSPELGKEIADTYESAALRSN